MKKNFLYTPVYLILILIIGYFKVAGDYYLEAVAGMRFLSGPTGGMLGQATKSGLDVASRVRLFYFTLMVFGVGVSLFYYLGRKIREHFSGVVTEFRLMEESAMSGLLIGLFYLLGCAVKETFLLVLIAFSAGFIFFILRITIFRNRTPHYKFYLFLYFLSLCSSFGLTELFLMIGFHVPLQLAFGLILIGSYIVALGLGWDTIRNWKVLIPVSLLPLLTFLSDEIYLWFNGRESFFIHPNTIYLIGLTLILISVGVLVYQKSRPAGSDAGSDQYPFPGKIILPLALIGIIVVSEYDWVQTWNEKFGEYFELANPVLSVQRYYEQGMVPFFETFNSHLLSDIANHFTYTAVHGYDGSFAMQCYGFVTMLICALPVYFLLKKFTTNPVIAFVLVLIVPVTLEVLGYFTMFLVVILAFIRAMDRKNFWSIFWFWISVILTCLYALDEGVATISSCVLMIGYLVVTKRLDKSYIQPALRSLLLALGLLVSLVLSIAWLLEVDVPATFTKALNYLTSFQSYAYLKLGSRFKSVFNLHYIILPALLVLTAIWLVVKRRNFLNIKRVEPQYIIFAFFVLYQFINFQRGLVRHSFKEGMGLHMATFTYFLIPVGIMYFMKTMRPIHRYFVGVVLSAVVLLGIRFPAYNFEWSPTFEYAMVNFNKVTKQSISRDKKERGGGIKQQIVSKSFHRLKQFLEENTDKDQTFIDFMNKPMLYFYMEKPTPSYFNQPLLSSHNDVLQKQFVEDVQKYDCPVALLPNADYGYQVDFIRNDIRHPWIAEYIYKNYTSIGMIDSASVWVRNDFKNKEVFPVRRSVLQSIRSGDAIATDTIGYNYLKLWLRWKDQNWNGEFQEGLHKPKNIFAGNNVLYFRLTGTDQDTLLMTYVRNMHHRLHEVELIHSRYPLDLYYDNPGKYDVGMIPHQNANFDIDYSTFETVYSEKEPLVLAANESAERTLTPTYFPLEETQYLYFETNYKNQPIDPWRPVQYSIQVSYGKEYRTLENITIGIGQHHENKYLIRLSSQYNWVKNQPDWIKFQNRNVPVELSNIRILSENEKNLAD